MTDNPEIGKQVKVNGYPVNYLEEGDGETVLLLHGSGPGVTAYANWRLLIPELSRNFHVIAPDIIGFGYTESPPGFDYNLKNWIQFVIDFMDALNIKRAHLVGNSFGGAVSLAITAKHPERVNRFVLMGAAGINFEITEGLEKVWGYKPSLEAMRDLMETFAYNKDLVNDDIVQSRYEASIRPGYQETFEKLYPAPYQETLNALHLPESELQQINHHALIVHGREDAIVPLDCSIRAHHLLKHSDLHVFGECGHWTQIERADDFSALVEQFFLKPL